MRQYALQYAPWKALPSDRVSPDLLGVSYTALRVSQGIVPSRLRPLGQGILGHQNYA